MPDLPIVLQVLEAVETRLAAITAGSTYFSTVAEVRRNIRRTPTVWPACHLELVSVAPAEGTAVEGLEYEERDLLFIVNAYAKHAEDPQEAATKLERDVQVAIEVDPTFGGLAIDTFYTATQFVTLADTEASAAIARVAFTSRLSVNRKDPSELPLA